MTKCSCVSRLSRATRLPSPYCCICASASCHCRAASSLVASAFRYFERVAPYPGRLSAAGTVITLILVPTGVAAMMLSRHRRHARGPLLPLAKRLPLHDRPRMLLLAVLVTLHDAQHERLAESARTAEEQETAHLLELRYPLGLVHIVVVLPPDAAEVGDAHRQ